MGGKIIYNGVDYTDDDIIEFSDDITVNDGYEDLISTSSYAIKGYVKNGWVIVRVMCAFNKGLNRPVTIPSAYRPKLGDGAIGMFASEGDISDANKVGGTWIDTSGRLNIYTNDASTSMGRFTVIYPLGM